MKTMLTFWLLALSLLPLGCAADRDLSDLLVPEDVDVLVVDAVLTVGQPFPSIRLTRTGAPTEAYEVARVLTGEDVHSMIIRGPESDIAYEDDDSGLHGFDENSGLFTTSIGGLVEPNTQYELVIKTERAEELRAVTITPPSLDINDWVLLDDNGENVVRPLTTYDDLPGEHEEIWNRNQLEYATGLLEARFDRPDVPAFLVAIFSLDLDSDYVIDPDFFEEEDFEDLDRIGSSPPLEGEGGSLRLPWFAIFFEGRYTIKIFSMDQNWYDLARSAPGFGDGGPGFGGQAGDDFERPIFHIEGGIGLFGSAAVDSIGFSINPRP